MVTEVSKIARNLAFPASKAAVFTSSPSLSKELNFESDKTLIAFIFLSSIVAYNFVKYLESIRFQNKHLSVELKWILFFSVLMLFPLIYLTFLIEYRVLLWLLALGLLTVLYALPLVPINSTIKHVRGLRAISGIKIYIIAFIWSAVTVIVPIVNEDMNLNSDLLIIVIQRFLFVLVLMLPFEIRDLSMDNRSLATIPQTIGIMQTRLMGIGLVGVYLLLDFFKDELSMRLLTIDVVMSLILVLVLLKSKEEQSTYFASFWVEAVPIVWLGLLLMFG